MMYITVLPQKGFLEMPLNSKAFLKFIQEIEKTVGDGRCGGRLILLLFYRKELYYET